MVSLTFSSSLSGYFYFILSLLSITYQQQCDNIEWLLQGQFNTREPQYKSISHKYQWQWKRGKKKNCLAKTTIVIIVVVYKCIQVTDYVYLKQYAAICCDALFHKRLIL